MRWPWPWRRHTVLPDRRDEALRAVEQSRSDLEQVRAHGRRVARIHAALMHEGAVNGFTERWQQQIHPRGSA